MLLLIVSYKVFSSCDAGAIKDFADLASNVSTCVENV